MNKLLTFLLIFICYANFVKGNEFFQDITYQVLDNQPRLSYGVSVTDACIDWETTKNSILSMADKLRPMLKSREL